MRRIHNAEVDVNYSIYYPLLKPYVSLFPKVKKGDDTLGEVDKSGADNIDGPKGNPEMWKAVESAMQEGTLEALRESKDGVTIPGPKPAVLDNKKMTKPMQGHGKGQEVRKDAHKTLDEDEDSDIGFFE